MPVCLFTFHGYRTWMPDHPDGFTRRDLGVLAPDAKLSQRYEEQSKHDEIRFDDRRQCVVLNAVSEVCQNLSLILYYCVCVSTHVHVLVGWKDDR